MPVASSAARADALSKYVSTTSPSLPGGADNASRENSSCPTRNICAVASSTRAAMGVQASPKETSGGVGRRDHFAGEVRDQEIGNCGDDTGGSDRNDDVPRSSSYAQRNRGAVASAWADHGTTDSDTCWLGGSKDARYDRVVTEGGAEQVHPVFAAEGGDQ
jgi:hypothetical protein